MVNCQSIAAHRDANVTVSPTLLSISRDRCRCWQSRHRVCRTQRRHKVFKTSNATAASPTSDRTHLREPLLPGLLPAGVASAGRADECKHRLRWHGGYANDNLWEAHTTGTTAALTSAAGLPPSPVRGIARHPTQATWFYAGTGTVGPSLARTSAPRGAASDGPANVGGGSAWTGGNTLVAATHGRGMFRATIPGRAPRVQRDAPHR